MAERQLYLFNPENDLALAAGTANYTPAANVVEFHNAGAMLPLWYSDNSSILSGSESDADWLNRKCDDFGLSASVVGHCEGQYACRPWGWSANAVRQFVKAGVSGQSLPSKDFTEGIRLLSHRRTAAKLATGLRPLLNYPLPMTPIEAVRLEQVTDFLKMNDGGFMKSPWSGSGRGVLDTTLLPAQQVLKIAEGIIHRQGSVMLEQRLDKVMDFAMLFEAVSGDEIRHVGYSMFFNETANAYGGNRIMSDERMSDEITSLVGERNLAQTTSAIVPVLTELLRDSGYTGYFGVDMMVYKSSGGEMLICPTVEINLRMTMGVVAWRLGRDILAAGREGTLRIRYAPKEPFSDRYMVTGGRLTGGVLSLVPEQRNFRITLSVD